MDDIINNKNYEKYGNGKIILIGGIFYNINCRHYYNFSI
jgi:hypothetical protein